MVVEWIPDARKDLAGIWEYYSTRNFRAAVKILHEIETAVLRAGRMPLGASIERYLDDMPGQHRSVVVKRNHKVVYRVVGEIVYIIAIFDCRRDPSVLRRRAIKAEA
jgi:plasmid stabilization system protein ParE